MNLDSDKPQPISSDRSGQVITFYSYKGGTGRSMALANVGCLLAQQTADDKGVLMIDWDMEAPGLHRFFRDRFGRRLGKMKPEDLDHALDMQPGLINLFIELNQATERIVATDEDQAESATRALLENLDLNQYVLETDIPSLYFLKAGRFDNNYAALVNTFPWEKLYNRTPHLFRQLAEWLSQKYRYVLIDSRTGTTDISSICTALMPEKLVVVFTPNRQSLLGVSDLVRRITKYRRESDDLRSLVVFPLPSRIVESESDQLTEWRMTEVEKGVPGFQPLFASLFKEVYELSACNLAPYFNEVQIQHHPTYAYGEKVAVLIEQSENRLGLPRSYDTLVQWLVNRPVPWEVLEPVKAETTTVNYGKIAEKIFSQFKADEQEEVERLFKRLVRIPGPREAANYTRLQVEVNELDAPARPIIKKLVNANLVVMQVTDDGKKEAVVLADEAIIRTWKRLHDWLDKDRDFSLYCQQLFKDVEKWEAAAYDQGALLRGTPLVEADNWMRRRPRDLSEKQRQYITESLRLEEQEKFERERREREEEVERLSRKTLEEIESKDRKRLEETERQRREDELKRRRRMRWVVAASAMIFLLAGGLSIKRFLAPNEQQRRVELSRQLAQTSITSQLATSSDPDRSLLLAVEANKIFNTPEAESALRLILSNSQAGLGSLSPLIELRGHTDAVYSAAFSPDGKQVVTASWDSTARVWEVATGRIVSELRGGTGPFYSAAFSPDGKQVVTTSYDKIARIWDIATGRIVLELKGHTGYVFSAAFSPDGKQVVTGSYDKTARTWDVATGRTVLEFTGHTGVVTSVAFSPDGKQVVTGSYDSTARIWDVATGRTVLELRGHTDIIYSAAFSPDGKQVVTASRDKTARIWEVATGRTVLEFKGHADVVFSAAFSPDSKQVVTTSYDRIARVWDATTGHTILELKGHNGYIFSAVFSPDGKQVVTACFDRIARIYM